MNLVEQAIEQIRLETVNYVVNSAKNYVDRVIELLRNADWDLDVAYPYPKSYGPNAVYDRKVYKTMLDKRNFAHSLTVTDKVRTPAYRRTDDHLFVEFNQELVNHYLEGVRKMADQQFVDFTYKLTQKISLDNVSSIVLDDLFKWPWEQSILHVIRNDGTKEKWKTQIIVKTSCLGKVFNQWPTRKVK